MSVSAHNLEAERSVLGGILADNDLFDVAVQAVKPEDFYRAGHQFIYRAMFELVGRQLPIDLLTVKEQLAKKNQLEEVGGPSYVAALVDGVPHTTNVEYYARIVREKSLLRRLEAAAAHILAATRSADADAADVLNQAERALLELSLNAVPGEPVWADEMAREVYPVIERLHQQRRPVTGVSSGIPSVDRMTRGFQPGNLVIIAGRPSQGKTSIAIQFGLHVARTVPVAFFSLEMSRQELEMRMIANLARVDAHSMQCGQLSSSDQERVGRAIGEFATLGISVDDSPSITPLQVRSKARRVKAQRGLGMLVVDYLQLMSGGGKFENRTQEVSALSRHMKAVARDLNVPALVLSQLNRGSEQRAEKRPQLSDLRESGAIEQDADVVLMVHRPPVPEGYQPMTELIIGKHRNGPVGTIEMAFVEDQMRFTEVERR